MKRKPKLVMVGHCPLCGTEFVRKPPVDAAACMCIYPDAKLVPLTLAVSIPKRQYNKFSKIADLAGIPVEELVMELLTESMREKLEELQSFPTITVGLSGEKLEG